MCGKVWKPLSRVNCCGLSVGRGRLVSSVTLQTFWVPTKLANARRRLPVPGAPEANEAPWSRFVPNVSRFGGRFRRHSFDFTPGGDILTSNRWELSPDFAENKRRFPAIHWRGFTSASPSLLSASRFMKLTEPGAPGVEDTTAQSSER